MDITNLAVAGAIVCELFAFAAVTAFATSAMKARHAMLGGAAMLIVAVALLVTAQVSQSLSILVIGAAVTGVATALAYRGSLQVIHEIAPQEQRAEVISSFKIVCFSGTGLPVIGVGVLSSIWSPTIATVSLAAMTSVLALVAFATEMGSRKQGLQASPRAG